MLRQVLRHKRCGFSDPPFSRRARGAAVGDGKMFCLQNVLCAIFRFVCLVSLLTRKHFGGQVCARTESPAHAIFMFEWEYDGANEEKHGEQCVLVGDKVHDDVLGEGTAVRLDGAMIIIEFLEEDASQAHTDEYTSLRNARRR